jgi:cytochrome c-type biogenesis protein CcmE
MVFKPTLSKDRLNLYCKNITSLNDYSVQLLVYTLVKNNIFPPNSVWNNIEQLLSEKKISHVYEKLLLAIINLFARMDFVDLRQGKIHFTLLLAQYAEKVNQLNLQKHKDRILAEEPLLSVLINLIDKCIVNYPNILTDNLHPFQILFPNGSLKQIEEVYTQDIIANYYNQTLATLILNKIENKLLSSKKISILEVGAGTGATSRYVLLALKHLDQNIDYFYSDVSTTCIILFLILNDLISKSFL